jgi:LysR family transcriptional regulator, hypochlorite-specific transcription factor HypT
MQLKWLEDLIALAQTRSFSRAAQLRHVTHPAFGRRIKSLEQWAGAPLVDHASTPVALTPAGEKLLEAAHDTVALLTDLRRRLAQDGDAAQSISVATGRTLARTLCADWIARVQRGAGAKQPIQWKVITRELGLTIAMLEEGAAHYLLCYYHPALSIALSPQRYMHIKVGDEKLVLVGKANASGAPQSPLAGRRAVQPLPLISYAPSLALGKLVQDHLKHSVLAVQLTPRIECDSADAAQEYVLKGMGVAWLPWSLAAPQVKRKLLAPLAGKVEEIAIEVRLYRPKRTLPLLAELVWQHSG